jgi:hypothetical protein
MESVQEAILANADDHTRLITAIDDLEYVPASIKRQKSEIADLENRLVGIQAQVTQRVRQSTNKKKKYESLRDSKVKKWAYKHFRTEESYEAEVSERER